MVGYFSYLPNVTEGIMNTQGMPFRDEFLRMDPQLLSFITLVFIVAFIAVKAYIIGVIWNCYKYLMLRNTVIRGVIAYRHDDPTSIMGLQQNLLPDLPDYETAVNDPRYAKKPPSDSATTGVSQVGNLGFAPQVTAHAPQLQQQQQVISMPPPPPYSVAVASEPLHLVIPMNNNNNNNVIKDEVTLVTSDETQATATEDIHLEPATEQATAPQASPVFVHVQQQLSPDADAVVTTVATDASTTNSTTVENNHQ